MQDFNVLSVAQWLVHQHANKIPFAALPKNLALSNARQAEAVQSEFVRIKAQQCGDVANKCSTHLQMYLLRDTAAY